MTAGVSAQHSAVNNLQHHQSAVADDHSSSAKSGWHPPASAIVDLRRYQYDMPTIEGFRSMKTARKPANQPKEGTPLRLGGANMASFHIWLEPPKAGEEYGDSRCVYLPEVPAFLIDAFNLIRVNGLSTEGIFRKEGNANRLKSVWMPYYGCVGIPGYCSVHDVCVMVKRFFRELDPPLFGDIRKQTQMLNFTGTLDDPVRFTAVRQLIETLKPAHHGTIGFVMRQLQFLAMNSVSHQMTAENLATVFAPSIFRDDPLLAKRQKKDRAGSHDDLLFIRNNTDLKIAVIRTLIENAEKIGFRADDNCQPPTHVDLGLGSRDDNPNKSRANSIAGGPRLSNYQQSRSTSAKPINRAAHKKENDPKRSPKKESPPSDGESKERRSSSTVRGFFSQVTSKLRRGSSPQPLAHSQPALTSGMSHYGGQRASAGNALTTEKLPNLLKPSASHEVCRELNGPSSTASVPSTIQQQSSQRQRRGRPGQTPDPRMRLNFDAAETDQSNEEEKQEPAPSSSSSRRSRRSSPPPPAVVNAVNPVTANRFLADVLHGLSPVMEPDCHMSPRYIGARDGQSTAALPKKAIARLLAPVPLAADNSHSLLSEEYFTQNPTPIDRRRRHTAPVKHNGLRRNQPNTVNTGLKAPRARRATTLSLHDESSVPIEPNTARLRSLEGKKRRSQSAERDHSPTSSASDEGGAAGGATGGAKMSSTGFTAAVLNEALRASEDMLEQKGIESRQRRAKRQRRKETGPPKNGEISLETNGEQSLILDAMSKLSPELGAPYHNRDVHMVSPQKFPPSTNDEHGSETDRRAMPTSGLPKQEAGTWMTVNNGDQVEEAVMHSSSENLQTANGNKSPGIKSASFVSAPGGSAWPNHSHNASLLFEKPMRKGISLDLEASEKQPVVGDADFQSSNQIKNQLLGAHSCDDLVEGPAAFLPPRHSAVDSRPSLAFIQQHKRGMVQQRVSQFAQIAEGKLSPPSIRSSPPGSSESSAIVEFVKPSAPPASHGFRAACTRLAASPSLSNSSNGRVAEQTKRIENAIATFRQHYYKKPSLSTIQENRRGSPRESHIMGIRRRSGLISTSRLSPFKRRKPMLTGRILGSSPMRAKLPKSPTKKEAKADGNLAIIKDSASLNTSPDSSPPYRHRSSTTTLNPSSPSTSGNSSYKTPDSSPPTVNHGPRFLASFTENFGLLSRNHQQQTAKK